jgi:branched-chain amino acid transport system ATP-binding protein
LHKLGKTIVLAEQKLHFCLGLADRAVVIDKGTDVFCGTIHELNDNAVIIQRYLSVYRLKGLLCIFQKLTPHRRLT